MGLRAPAMTDEWYVLLFGEPDRELTVRSAEVLIDALQSSQRWSVESCDQLREHLCGCGARSGAS